MYHLNYFEFMVQQRVQILMKYTACMGLPYFHPNTLVLFTELTSRDGCGVAWRDSFVENLPLFAGQ